MTTTIDERVRVDLGVQSYDILIGRGLIGAEESYRGLAGGAQAAVVSNTSVAPLYGHGLVAALKRTHTRVQLVQLPDGEKYKNSASLDLIFDALFESGSDRKTTVFALGGGVVGDIAGFAAAC